MADPEDPDRIWAPPTADLDLLYWTNVNGTEYKNLSNGFEWKVPEGQKEVSLNIEDEDKPNFESQKKAWAAKILATMSRQSKERLKKLKLKRPKRWAEKKLNADLVRAYFRNYRGDEFRRFQKFPATYKTDDWDGTWDGTVEGGGIEEDYPTPIWVGHRPGDTPPPEDPEDLADLTDEEMDECANEEEREALRQNRLDEQAEADARWAKRDAEQKRDDEKAKRKKEKIYNKFLQSNTTEEWYENTPLTRNEKWVGEKVLGEGGNGIAGLWKLNDPGNPDDGKVVVVKLVSRHGLVKNIVGQIDELKVLKRLKETGSEHITKLVFEEFTEYPQKRTKGRPLYPKEYVPRLFMEYLGGGDMSDFIKRACYKRERVTERTALDIFKCLVKGVATLNMGTENPVGTKGMRRQEFYNENPGKADGVGTWRPYVHHDLKPANIFIGYRGDEEHPVTRIFKVADFGLARQYESGFGYAQHPVIKRAFRTWGTPGWYVPEQFTERWDYPEWKEDPIAGYYCPASNIWAIGAIMWCLLLHAGRPNRTGYRSRLPSPRLAKGITYGKALEADTHPYSLNLKILILECLMENPRLRPREHELLFKVDRLLGICPEHRVGEAGEIYDRGGPGEDPVIGPVGRGRGEVERRSAVVLLEPREMVEFPRKDLNMEDVNEYETEVEDDGVGKGKGIDRRKRRAKPPAPPPRGLDIDDPDQIVGAAAPAEIRETIRNRKRDADSTSPFQPPRKKFRPTAEPMAANETFAQYIDRPNAGGLFDEVREAELAAGREKRVMYTEDTDELEWWDELGWPEFIVPTEEEEDEDDGDDGDDDRGDGDGEDDDGGGGVPRPNRAFTPRTDTGIAPSVGIPEGINQPTPNQTFTPRTDTGTTPSIGIPPNRRPPHRPNTPFTPLTQTGTFPSIPRPQNSPSSPSSTGSQPTLPSDYPGEYPRPYGATPLTINDITNARARRRVEVLYARVGYVATVDECVLALRLFGGDVGRAEGAIWGGWGMGG